jgi:ubiquinone/menaquinone biosynthesis C-methylase UbiE
MFVATGGNTLIDVPLILKKAGITERNKVADFGCGSSGLFVFGPAKMVGKNGKVYAVDILKPILENIKREARQENLDGVIETVWTDLEVYNATKIEAGILDVGLLINTLYQSHRRVEIMREALRLIKKGGRLVIVEWKDVSIPFGPPVEERVKLASLENGAAKLGLRMDEEFQAGQYHYGVIFTKL